MKTFKEVMEESNVIDREMEVLMKSIGYIKTYKKLLKMQKKL